MTANCGTCSFALAAANTPNITSYDFSGKTITIGGSKFPTTTDVIVKLENVLLGNLSKTSTSSSASSLSVTFDEYPKPGTPKLRVYFKDGTSY